MSGILPDWSAAEGAYDAVSRRYDRIPEENRINRLMRARSLARLRGLFRPGDTVLDVGCGTGDEALDLAARGVRVVAVDPSAEMVRVARGKADARGLADRITFRRGRARELAALGLARGSFGGAYASFSLAYEPEVRPVAKALHGLLRRDATFLASVPSRVCLVEWIASLALGRPSLAGRRLRPWHGHTVAGGPVPIRTYTPADVARAFAPEFAMTGWEALVALVPPPFANPLWVRLDGFADAVERADDRIRRGLLRSVGDHFLAEFRHRLDPEG